MKKLKVVFVGSADHHGEHLLEGVKGYAETIGIDIGPDFLISNPSSAKSISAALEAMRSYNPDFAYLSLSSKEASWLPKEAKAMGLPTRWTQYEGL